MIIRHNSISLRSYNSSRKTAGELKKNLEKLSSGYRINRSADDAAGLTVSERIHAKVTELGRCQYNATEGMDLAKTADAALAEVNDMLKRARSLCIQAENGTYSDQELASISDELNKLFSEVERIAKGSRFNTIPLFQGKVEEIELPFHYEFQERFSPVGSALQTWGGMSFVQEGDFDRAQPAKMATATFQLDEDIDLNDVKTLNGRSITVSYPGSVGSSYNYSKTFYFTDGSSPTPPGSTGIRLNSYPSVESALKQMCSRYNYYDGLSVLQDVTLDRAARTVTMTMGLKTLSHTVNGTSFPVGSGNGSWANEKASVGNPAGAEPLGEVDGGGAANNRPVYSDTVECTLRLTHVRSSLTETDIKNLNGNTLNVGGNRIALKDLGLTAGNTRDDLGNALVRKITSFGNNWRASYDNTTSTLSVKLLGRSTTTASPLTISETVTPGTDPTYKPNEYGSSWTSTPLNLSVTRTQTSTPERPEIYEITIPNNPGVPFSFRAYSYDYLYYNSDQNKFTNGDYNQTSYSPHPDFRRDTKGLSQEQIVAMVANDIKARIGSRGEVTIEGNKLTVRGTSINSSMNLGSYISGNSITVTPYKQGGIDTPGVPGTSQVVNPSGSYDSSRQDVYIPFALTSEADIPNLAGRGFGITSGYNQKYEFVNGAGTGKNDDYIDIDISGCNTYESLRNKVQQVMRTGYTVEIDQAAGAANATLKICTTSTSSASISVTDGNAGVKGLIAGGGSVKFSGGTDAGHSQKAIDFSGIQTREDLEALLGKGFRITCATCSGEYINVFFCWEKSPDIPLSFERKDPDTGEIRTIHNIPVELSKITDGSSIVRSIVEQVSPSLKHFTDVAVGDPPTVLMAQDKRRGDVKDAAGKLYLGKVLSGVEANFTYSVSRRKVLDNPEDADAVVVQSSDVKIYVGSDPEAQFISVHLPHLDLETLKLDPEGGVDLTDPSQSASSWLARVDRADLAIADARGTIGADYNRLEHAKKDLSNADIQLSDALSVVRDTDMAQLMMKQVKDQILFQAQQSMMSQANQTAQNVLRLVQ